MHLEPREDAPTPAPPPPAGHLAQPHPPGFAGTPASSILVALSGWKGPLPNFHLLKSGASPSGIREAVIIWQGAVPLPQGNVNLLLGGSAALQVPTLVQLCDPKMVATPL